MLLALAVDGAADQGTCAAVAAPAFQPRRSRIVRSVAISSPSSPPLRNGSSKGAPRAHRRRRGASHGASGAPRGAGRRGPRRRGRGSGSRRGTVAPRAQSRSTNPSSAPSVRPWSSTDPVRARSVPTRISAVPSNPGSSQVCPSSPTLSRTSTRSPSRSRSQARTSGATPKMDRCVPRAQRRHLAPRRDQTAVERSGATPDRPPGRRRCGSPGRRAGSHGVPAVKPPVGRRVPLHRRPAAIAAGTVERRFGQ